MSTEQRTLHCERGPLQSLTLSRFAAHVSVAILMSILYWNVGNNIDKSRDHVAALFFHVLIIMFAAMMPTVQTCALATFPNTLHTQFVRARLTPDRALYVYLRSAYYCTLLYPLRIRINCRDNSSRT